MVGCFLAALDQHLPHDLQEGPLDPLDFGQQQLKLLPKASRAWKVGKLVADCPNPGIQERKDGISVFLGHDRLKLPEDAHAGQMETLGMAWLALC